MASAKIIHDSNLKTNQHLKKNQETSVFINRSCCHLSLKETLYSVTLMLPLMMMVLRYFYTCHFGAAQLQPSVCVCPTISNCQLFNSLRISPLSFVVTCPLNYRSRLHLRLSSLTPHLSADRFPKTLSRVSLTPLLVNFSLQLTCHVI